MEVCPQVPDVRGRHAPVDAVPGDVLQLPPRRQLLGRTLRQGDPERRQQQICLFQVSQPLSQFQSEAGAKAYCLYGLDPF